MAKLKSKLKLLSSFIAVLALPLAVLALSAPANAASNSSSSSSSSQPQITRAYSTDENLQNGMIVGVNPARPDFVEALSSGNISQMQGVVVPANSSPVTISGNGDSTQVYVATLGRYQVLVSDQNGPINSGDYITISSIAGIGMKADNSQQLVVGKAASNFNGGQSSISSQTLNDGRTINIGFVTVDLGIAHNPLKSLVNQHNSATQLLLNLSKSVTGKEVGTARIYAALVVFIVVAIIVAIVLYAGIRGDMIAAGRNPLAKAAIGRNLFEVVMSAIVIFIIGLGAIYLLLKL